MSVYIDIDDALQRLRQQHIDIVLLDWNDGGDRSLALCEQIRLVSSTYLTLTTVIPKQETSYYRIRALDAGADVRYLRLKLEAHNPERLIHTVRYVGYVLQKVNDGQSRTV